MDLLVEASGAANPKRRKIANPLDNDYFFGFLSKRILPEVPSFPIFPRQGKVLVSIKLCKNQITLDEETFERAMKFHEYLFDDVLGLAKQGFVEFVPRHAPIATVIVPLKRREHAVYDLDRVYLSNILEYRRIPYTPSEEERRTFQFREEDFTDAIVVPWYRNQDVFYDVAVINHSLTPASGFPDGNYTNFREYYMKRYNLEIFNETQPLLDVDYTSTRMNLVMPRIPTRSQGKEKKSDRTQHQVMVPELVNVHPIPASLWNSIVTLPTIIYRANALLLADELRELICAEALGPNDNSVHICWEPLDYVTSYSEDAQLPINKLSHLEKDLEAERAKARAENPEPEIVDMEDDSSNDGFNIGVWDPKLGDGGELAGRILTVPFPMAPSARTDEEIADEAADMIVTSGNLNNGNMSDDEDDQGEMKMLMDYAHIYKNDSSSFLPVRDNIEELGWDADIGQLNISEDAFPVSITGTSASIDGKSLMKDIASVLDPSFAGNGVASANGSAPNGSGDAVFAKSKPVATRLDLSAFDDRDAPLIRTGENESLNLIEYFMDSNDSQEVERMKKASLEIESSRPHLENFPVVEVEEEGTPQKAIEIDNSLFTNPNVLQPEINAYTDGEVGERSEVARVIPKTTFMKPDVKVNFTDEGMPECSAGVSPCVLLQALTLSHASDGINLERLETVGDSFLKFAVTDYLFHEHKEQHEGKLSFARSKEVSNYNLYRIGKKKNLPSILVASKFEPTDSWLPPCYMPTGDFKGPNAEDAEATDKFMDAVFEGKPIPQSKKPLTGWDEDNNEAEKVVDGIETINLLKNPTGNTQYDVNEEISPLPYNVMTQQYISDKAIADTVEALIGAHLLQLGPKVALRFMRWLGLRVISEQTVADEPLLRFLDTPEDPNRSNQELVSYIERFQLSSVEKTIGYRFNNKAYLLQAFTHASYYKNRITSCYQRLEFLGDAVLDYMITRFLFQHRKKYSPGVLTDLRSALVNNTIFASLAVKYNFHKHFVAMCPGLHHMIEKFVRLCESQAKNTNFNSELYMVTEEEFDDGDEEDIEVPKALGDIFESLAGAIYLDSGRRLDVVWEVFYNLMHDTIMECCEHPPKSPIRELLEREPDKARFSKLERIRENGKIRVTVDIQGKCRFTGIGRSYRIAKCTAAKRALRYLRDLDKEREAAKKATAHH